MPELPARLVPVRLETSLRWDRRPIDVRILGSVRD